MTIKKINKYETIFARSFTKYEQKNLTYAAFLAALLIAFAFCTIFSPYHITLIQPLSNLRLSFGDAGLMLLRTVCPELVMPRINQTSDSNITSGKTQNSFTQLYSMIKSEEQLCNFGTRSDYCDLKGDVRIVGNSSTVFVASSKYSETEIKPYARKTDEAAMNQVSKWSIKSIGDHHEMMMPKCTVYHSVPAVLFSSGGYAGNNFHDFSDIIIPLYVTSRPFNGQVKFLITDRRFWFLEKFRKLLNNLSKYDLIINIDKTEQVHCFSRVIVGLKRHQDEELKIDDSVSSTYTMKDFREFLRRTFSLMRKTKATSLMTKLRRRLLILARNQTRAFTNLEEIVKDARRLGFQVEVAEADSDIAKFAGIVNSCDVMVGVHGAGLTNMVFMPEKAVLIQVVPIGEMEWMAARFYGEPAKGMELRYLEYRITAEESSLRERFPAEHEVFQNPKAFKERGWEAFYQVYMVEQNVKLDVHRFRSTLLHALHLLNHNNYHHFS